MNIGWDPCLRLFTTVGAQSFKIDYFLLAYSPSLCQNDFWIFIFFQCFLWWAPFPPDLEENYTVFGYIDDIKPAVTSMEEFSLIDRGSALFEAASGCILHRSLWPHIRKSQALAPWPFERNTPARGSPSKLHCNFWSSGYGGCPTQGHLYTNKED